MKTLIFEDEAKKPLCILMHGDREVSAKNLARQLGVKSVAPCAPRSRTGIRATRWAARRRSASSARCRSAARRPSRDLPLIYINGGARGFLVGIDPRICVRVLAAALVEVAIV